MESAELSISVGELIGVPKVTLRGCMAGWHDDAVLGILTSLHDRGFSSLVLDIAGMTFVGSDGTTSMINVLRSLAPGMGVHVVASGAASALLGRANLSPAIRLYSSTDELAEYITPDEACYTSRWMAWDIEEGELPMAA